MTNRAGFLYSLGLFFLLSISIFAQESPTPSVVIDSENLVILDGEVSSNHLFRGVPFSATVYNGMAHFLFSGDLVFNSDDFIRGIGSNVISLTVSGDVHLPEGAVLDVSADGILPGPGGGAAGPSKAGGTPGNGGLGRTGGDGGSGGDGGGGFGGNGDPGNGGGGGRNGDSGTNGNHGERGEYGGDGYRSPQSGGEGSFNDNRGLRGVTGGVVDSQSGFGGQGGTDGPENGGKGSDAEGGGTKGDDGTSGIKGADGQGGGIARFTSHITAGGGGASGQGGGAGGGGAGGASGTGGGGGGGGGGGFATGGGRGGTGGQGGESGDGGKGGAGGQSGAGGAGAGAIEIIAYGKMYIAGSLSATGSDGASGVDGESGMNGEAGKDGSNGSNGSTANGGNGGKGGKGAPGGNGGNGGDGGPGGNGGGGAGGTIKLIASVLSSDEPTANVNGGHGGLPGMNDGERGRFIFGSNIDTVPPLEVEDTSLEIVPGPRNDNPHLSGSFPTPYIPGLIGGAEVAGILNGLNVGSLSEYLGEIPSDAHLAVIRLNVGPGDYAHSFEGYDMLLLLNLTCDPVHSPVLGMGSQMARLIQGGVATWPQWGGTGPGLLVSLEPFAVYATLIPNKVQDVRFGFIPDSTLISRQVKLSVDGQVAFLSHVIPPCQGMAPEPEFIPVASIEPPAAGPLAEFVSDGALQVFIEPQEAVDAGAFWSLKGRPELYRSGTLVKSLEQGLAELEFGQIPGWLQPRSIEMSILPLGNNPKKITVRYTKAKTLTIGQLASQQVRHGDTLGFYVAEGADYRLVSGNPVGRISLQSDGWFSYRPEESDRIPFTVEFTHGNATQIMRITPLPDLPTEHSILALNPVATPPDSSGRDYTFVHQVESLEGVNFLPASSCRNITLSGKQLVFDAKGDRYLYDLVRGGGTEQTTDVSQLNIYAEEVIIRSVLHLEQTNIRIHARDLRFEDFGDENAQIITKPVARSGALGLSDGPGLNGGNMTLVVNNIISDPSSEPRFVLDGGDSDSGPGGNSGQLAVTFEGLFEFVSLNGGTGHQGLRGEVSNPQILDDDGSFPIGYQWLHPLNVRAVLVYAKDLYYFGFIEEAGSLLLEYQTLLQQVIEFGELPAMLNATEPTLQFGVLLNEISTLADRIADKLDFYGNEAGWVPLLSFEVNFKLTDLAIERAMRTLYLSHWLTRGEDLLNQDLNALNELQDKLGEENDSLIGDFSKLEGDIETLETEAGDIEHELDLRFEELKQIESRLEQKANEVVEDRNRVPEWKKGLRTMGAIMQMVPIAQPALAAVGGGLDLATKIDEQDPLDSVLTGVSIVTEFKGASYLKQAKAITDELNQENLSDKELERVDLLEKSENMQALTAGLQTAGASIRAALQQTEAPLHEIQAELEDIRLADPQFNAVSLRIEELMLRKEQFARNIAKMEDRLRSIPSTITKNRMAMEQLAGAVDDRNAILDPQALAVVKEAEQAAKNQLRRYFYLLAKSFEYRLLEPYFASGSQVYDPITVFEKIEEILKAIDGGEAPDIDQDGMPDVTSTRPHVLSPEGFDSLRSILEGELTGVSRRIVKLYEEGSEKENTFPYTVKIQGDQLGTLGKNKGESVINLYKIRSLLPPTEEAHRIANLTVTDVDFDFIIDGEVVTLEDARLERLDSADIDVNFIHSGLSKILRKGQVYHFNHFRDVDPAKNPVSWKAKIDLLNREVEMVLPSLASQSLLSVLLGTTDELGVLNFSRPSAWADLWVNSENLIFDFRSGFPPAGLGIQMNSIELKVDLDFYANTGQPMVDVQLLDQEANPIEIKPKFWFDSETGPLLDMNQRGDSRGAGVRFFHEPTVFITAEPFVGSGELDAGQIASGYMFQEWRDSSLLLLPNNGEDRIPDPSLPNLVEITNNDQKRFYAVYRRIGDLEVPSALSIVLDAGSYDGVRADYIVQFSEEVFGVDASDFTIPGLEPGEGIVGIAGSGATRIVTLDTTVLGESVRLELQDDDSILDRAGNSLSGDGLGNGNLASTLNTFETLAFLTLSQVRTDQVQLTLFGKEGETYIIQSSNDLGTWESVTELTIENGQATLDQPIDLLSSQRYFRAIRE